MYVHVFHLQLHFILFNLQLALVALYSYIFFQFCISLLGSLHQNLRAVFSCQLRNDCLGRPTYTKLGRFVNTIRDTTFTFLAWLTSLDFSLSHFQSTAVKTKAAAAAAATQASASYSDTNERVSKTYIHRESHKSAPTCKCHRYL